VGKNDDVFAFFKVSRIGAEVGGRLGHGDAEDVLVCHIYDHSFRLAKASFFAELGLVLRSEIAIAPMAKATKRCLKDSSFKLFVSRFQIHR
jgi:hypothetical protein